MSYFPSLSCLLKYYFVNEMNMEITIWNIEMKYYYQFNHVMSNVSRKRKHHGNIITALTSTYTIRHRGSKLQQNCFKITIFYNT